MPGGAVSSQTFRLRPPKSRADPPAMYGALRRLLSNRLEQQGKFSASRPMLVLFALFLIVCVFLCLIHGNRISRRSLGYVAEECPFCSETSVCSVQQVSKNVPLRGAVTLAHEARCMNCQRQFNVWGIYYHGF